MVGTVSNGPASQDSFRRHQTSYRTESRRLGGHKNSLQVTSFPRGRPSAPLAKRIARATRPRRMSSTTSSASRIRNGGTRRSATSAHAPQAADATNPRWDLRDRQPLEIQRPRKKPDAGVDPRIRSMAQPPQRKPVLIQPSSSSSLKTRPDGTHRRLAKLQTSTRLSPPSIRSARSIPSGVRSGRVAQRWTRFGRGARRGATSVGSSTQTAACFVTTYMASLHTTPTTAQPVRAVGCECR